MKTLIDITNEVATTLMAGLKDTKGHPMDVNIQQLCDDYGFTQEEFAGLIATYVTNIYDSINAGKDVEKSIVRSVTMAALVSWRSAEKAIEQKEAAA